MTGAIVSLADDGIATTAPQTRFVDQFTGRLAGRPSKFFQALSEADERIAKAALALADVDDAAEQIGLLLEENAGLRHRIQELEGELAAARGERDTANARAQVTR